jgi:hypothetical protein
MLPHAAFLLRSGRRSRRSSETSGHLPKGVLVSPVILFGVISVNLALIAYTVGVIAAHRGRRATAFVLGVFALGVVFDLLATGCMMAGSHKPWFTPHGIVGYLALAVMLVAVARLWGLRRQGPDAPVPAGLHVFLRVAYVAWLVAYAIGATLAARR